MFGSESLVASLRHAALLCLWDVLLCSPCWVSGQGSARGSGCKLLQWGAVGTSPLSVSALMVEPQCCPCWTCGSNHISGCIYLLSAHVFTFATKCWREETFCAQLGPLSRIGLCRWVLGAAPSLLHVDIALLASAGLLWLQPGDSLAWGLDHF